MPKRARKASVAPPEGAKRRGETVRILIVDDHPVVRRGLAELISQEPGMEICAEAEGAPEAMKKVQETAPDLAIIDISLKEGSGVDLVKQLHASHPSLLLLVSSIHDEKLYAERVLNAGARGYVHKQAATNEILEAVRRVSAGEIYVSPAMSDLLLNRLVKGGDTGGDLSPMASLSDRELEVLTLIGQGLASRQIARRLHLSIKTIDTHRENIKAKLNLKTANELVRQAVAWTLEKT